jgi:large subunit ribosomal protein L15
VINVGDLECFENGETVNLEVLLGEGILKKPLDGLKVLGKGELTKNLTVEAAIFSAQAKEKIEAVGGKAEVNA